MPRNTAASKTAAGPSNTSEDEIVTAATPVDRPLVTKEPASHAARKTILQGIA
jgi:hypothetical protein